MTPEPHLPGGHVRAVALALAVRRGRPAVAPVDDAFPLVLKASAYVEAFQKNFGSMVSEERYEQSDPPQRRRLERARTSRGARS